MSTAFNTRRRPDAISKTISMDMHLGSEDPHNQYVLKTDLADLIAGGDIHIEVPIATTFENTNAKAAAAALAYQLNENLDAHIRNSTIHVTATQKADWDAKAPGNHRHDDLYVPLTTTEFVRKTTSNNDGIADVGIYPNTKETDAISSQYDLNQSPYLTQGMYFINPGNGEAVINGPNYIVGQTDTSTGFLLVNSTAESTSASSATIMQIFYGDNEIYKRVITKSGNTYTYGSWRLILASQPIGSLLFVTGSEIPVGYINANGGIFKKTVYPLLWEYASSSANVGSLVSQEEYGMRTAAGTLNEVKGKYCDVDSEYFKIPDYRGEFIKMWDDTSASRGLGTLEEASVPNITGSMTFNSGRAIAGAFGAFERITSSNPAYIQTSTSSTDTLNQVSFDASRVSSVYKNDVNTVTPENVTVHVCIHAYNGTILPQDTQAATIREIIADLLREYGYATTSQMGLVQLATVQEVILGEDDQHVITPSTLKQAYGSSSIIHVPNTDIYEVTEDTVVDPNKEYFKYVSGNYVTANDYYQSTDTVVDVTKTYYTIDTSTSTYVIVDDPTGNPSTSGYYEYKTVFDGTTTYYERITYGICCTAANVDISSPSNTYVDIDISEIVASSKIDQIVLTPMLVCIDASNDLLYPNGSVINNPVCAIKPNNSNEQLANVDFVVYNLASYKLSTDTTVVDGKEYYTRSGSSPNYVYTLVASPTGNPSTSNYYEVENLVPTLRVYWPLMWYLRAFQNKDATSVSGARLFPMVRGVAGSTPSIDDIKGQLTKWELQFKLSWQ